MGLNEKVEKALEGLNEKNTVTFIGADKLHLAGVSGQNMRVGVIDTGVDYTHNMFGGAGTKEAYEAIDPNTKNEFFPNAKVVGGADFVGIKILSRWIFFRRTSSCSR